MAFVVGVAHKHYRCLTDNAARLLKKPLFWRIYSEFPRDVQHTKHVEKTIVTAVKPSRQFQVPKVRRKTHLQFFVGNHGADRIHGNVSFHSIVYQRPAIHCVYGHVAIFLGIKTQDFID
jgi:hypothetical protein